MKRASKAFSCPLQLSHLLFNKRSLSSGENLSKRNYFIEDKYGVENFDTTELHRFSYIKQNVHIH